MPARLSIATEEGVILLLRLGSQPVSIGRAKDNALKSEDKRTSRHHAVVRRRANGGYEVEDLGSSYGTFLNGRLITKEELKHQDLVRCGALNVQYVDDPATEDEDDRSMISMALESLHEARNKIRQLIEEQAALRSEVGVAQQAEDRAKMLRDEAQDEVERLHGILDEQRKKNGELETRVAELGQQLRNQLAGKGDPATDVEALQKQVAELSQKSERQTRRVSELEARDAERATLQREIDRLNELSKKRDQREAELTQAVRPALVRIAELTQELEQTRLHLAHAEADLNDLRRRRP